jgi:hypothetical protein
MLRVRVFFSAEPSNKLPGPLGLPSANLTNAQHEISRIVSRVKWAGGLTGVILGCCLGLVNLLLIDMHQSSTLKLQAVNEEQEFKFSIETSNAAREDVMMLTVKGRMWMNFWQA